jgi:hypothetical protein
MVFQPDQSIENDELRAQIASVLANPPSRAPPQRDISACPTPGFGRRGWKDGAMARHFCAWALEPSATCPRISTNGWKNGDAAHTWRSRPRGPKRPCPARVHAERQESHQCKRGDDAGVHRLKLGRPGSRCAEGGSARHVGERHRSRRAHRGCWRDNQPTALACARAPRGAKKARNSAAGSG